MFFNRPLVLLYIIVMKSVLKLMNIKEVLVSKVSIYKKESV